MTSSSAESTDAVHANVSREIVPLGKVATIVSGFGFPKELQGKTEGALPFFKVGDISAAWNSGRQMLTAAQHYLSEEEAKSIKARAFPKGTIVFAKIGEAIKLNRRAILGQPALVDNNVMGLIPNYEVVDHRYLFYWTLTQKLGDISQATTVPSIRKSDVEELEFPLVHIDQQKRIVAEIEKQFSRLDEAVANLRRVKANLKRYKAAVLKAAVEGRLVEVEAASRRLQRPEAAATYETGAELLQRILETRRSQWQGKGKYKEPAAPDTAGLPELPEGWVWASSDAIFDFVTSGSRGWAQHYSDTGPLFIRVGNLDHQTIELDLSEVQRVTPPISPEADRSHVRSGDLLISITAELGMVAVVPQTLGEAYVNQHVAIARPTALLDRAYLGWFFACQHAGQRQLEALRRGATKAGLGLDDIRSVAVALPPLAEQHRIVAEVDRRLSLVREAETQVDANLKRAECLRQSVLSRAFSGWL